MGSKKTKPCDVAVVGHFSLDVLKLPTRSEPYRVMGGAVAFASLAARNLGASAAVVSKVGEDFPQDYVNRMLSAGVDVTGIVNARNEKTTSFELTYYKDLSERRLKLIAQGKAMAAAYLPADLEAKAIHIAPIAAEIPYEVVAQLRKCTGCLSIDPQGMTRRFGPYGSVECCNEMDGRILPLIDIYKSSAEEISELTGKADLQEALAAVHVLGPETVIATKGNEGCVVSVSGEVFSVPACRSTRVVDPTGAGDVFVGAFLAKYVRGHNSRWCACVGSAAASFVVEGVGSSFFGDKEEIYSRARAVYKKR